MSEQLINLVPMESQKKAGAIEQYVAQVSALVITGHVEYESAGNTLTEIKARWNEIDNERKKLKGPVIEQGKRIDDFFKAPLDALNSARDIINRKRQDYRADAERVRMQAEAKAQEAARKEQERLRKEADALAAKGKTEQAEAKRNIAEQIQAPVVAAPLPTTKGLSVRKMWRANVTDKLALIRAVATGTVPPSVLDVNQPVLNRMAGALKGEMNYPGVEAIEVESRE